MAYAAQANPTSQQQPFQRQQQYPQQQQAPQQQASPFKAPDMSAYGQQGSQQPRYNSYNVPRTPPKGAQANNLSGNVPSNQIWGQAYNQVAQQFGIPGATSFTMPGSYSSQGFDPSTGQYGPMTGGQSFDGNMAYNAINNRPGPLTASTPGLDGREMSLQGSLAQREAFVGNLSQRLGQYSSGQLTGPVTFDPSQLMQQANDQLANGTFYNPFSQQPQGQNAFDFGFQTLSPPNAMQNPDVQRAMGNSIQYMQGDFQNPFGSQANIQVPSWNQQSYNPNMGFGNDVVNVPQQQGDPMSRSPATWSDADLQAANQAAEARARQQAARGLMDGGVRYYRDPATGKVLSDSMSGRGQDATANWDAGEAWRAKNPTPIPVASRQQPVDDSGFLRGPQPVDDSGFVRPQPSDRVDFSKKPGSATPITPPEPGTSYDPQAKTQSLPPVPAAPAPPSYGEDPIAARKKAAKQKEQDAAGLQDLRSRWLSGATTGRSYKEHLGGKNFKDHTPDEMADEYTGELWKRLNDGRLSQADYDKAVSAMDTDLNQSKAGQAKIKQIGDELSNWRAATYGTWQGSGPPASNFQRIRELERLQERALAGDPAALAWNPKGKAPPPHATPIVPLNRRGSAARFGGLRKNGDNRR